MNARFSDFGLSRLYKRGTTFQSSKKYVGTTGYMAPELGCGNGSTASDVYALGIVLLELARTLDPATPDWVWIYTLTVIVSMPWMRSYLVMTTKRQG